ncbi:MULTISPECIES: polysaccharide pyruvyl transferase family protein [unclassified Halomonas]|uniref:polysaccharide pyruvyl transferase family protein n=1 Tax=unclassified Halomonas TaxID=2609666 RepID=UPI002076A255|nr:MULTISPECIES: polysaccharide pyruvyl transferase family protein [unclassified Halomonas]
MLTSLKSKIPLSIKQKLQGVLSARRMQLPDAPRCFVFLAADYGNIGDLAITAAQQNYLSRHLPNHQLVSVPISDTRAVIRSIRKKAVKEDVVTIIGGGNMGSLYPDIEALRQLVIRSFPRNRVVCFPQTLDWDDSEQSQRAVDRIVRVYSRHQNLYLHAREAVSFEKLKKLFADHKKPAVRFVPDIVLSATAVDFGVNNSVEPRGALLCLRDDRERSLSDHQHQTLLKALTDAGLVTEVTDTHAGGSCLSSERCAELLQGKLSQFQSAQLVVTDRLHGMILAALAGTPCLVLPNSNHKIRQTWTDWLRDVPQVRFLELGELSNIDGIVQDVLAIPRREPAHPVIEPAHYNDLRMAVADS